MKKFRSIAAAVLAASMVFALVGCGSSSGSAGSSTGTAETEAAGETVAAAEDAIVWKLAHTCADTTAVNDAALLFAERVKEATNGKLVIDVYPNSELGGNREALEGMLFGTIEMTIPNVGMLEGYSNSIKVLELPYLVEDVTNFEGAKKIFQGDLMQPIYDELAEHGILWKGSWFQGNRHLTTTKTRVEKPEDMKGLKIRTMESELHMAHFNALGANATPMAFSEVFTALQQGAIDGQENPYLNIYTQGMHEVQGYIIETAHIFDIIPLLCSDTAYNSLPDDVKAAFDKVCEEIVDEEWEMVEAQNNECKQLIKDAGKVEIVELTTEQRHKFREAVQSVYDKYTPEIGEELVNSMIAAQEG